MSETDEDPRTLAALSPRAARLHGDETFLVLWSASRAARRVSFAEFACWTRAASAHVQRWLPASPACGARVAMLAHASADSLALSLAVPSCGAVLVQLNWRQPEAALAAMLSGLGCCLLIAVYAHFAGRDRRYQVLCGRVRQLQPRTAAESVCNGSARAESENAPAASAGRLLAKERSQDRRRRRYGQD